MRINAAFETLLTEARPRVIQKESYTLKIIHPFAVRYEEEGKVLTFPIELKQKEGSWWIFGNYWEVTVEMPICWDNEEDPISVRKAELILSRMKEVLDPHDKKRYQFVAVQRP